jgi:hypothetical protein
MNGHYPEISETKWNIPKHHKQHIIVLLGQINLRALKHVHVLIRLAGTSSPPFAWLTELSRLARFIAPSLFLPDVFCGYSRSDRSSLRQW